MSTSAIESRFRQAVRNSEATAVPMNGLGAIAFSDTPCIGTDGLGSCSVVLIVSPYGAIMGHISPRPNDSNPSDPNAGDNHVQSFMQQVARYYQQSRQFFPADSNSWVICAVFDGAIALPDQQRIMERGLSDIGLPVDTNQTYVVPFTTDNPDRGSVFVDGRGGTIRVYVEDRVVRTMTRSQSPLAGSSTATASQSDTQGTGYWYFNVQENKYCYYMNQQVTWTLDAPPLNQWVKHFSGWNGDTSKQYMRWDGRQAEYR